MPERSYNLLSAVEAAKQIRKTKFFIYDEIHRGHLTCYKIGDGYMIKQEDLDAYLNARLQKALSHSGETKPLSRKPTRAKRSAQA